MRERNPFLSVRNTAQMEQVTELYTDVYRLYENGNAKINFQTIVM